MAVTNALMQFFAPRQNFVAYIITIIEFLTHQDIDKFEESQSYSHGLLKYSQSRNFNLRVSNHDFTDLASQFSALFITFICCSVQKLCYENVFQILRWSVRINGCDIQWV